MKPWFRPCGEGTWCANEGKRCHLCSREPSSQGTEDMFMQNDKCTVYTFSPNGHWPKDHPNKMKRDDKGEWMFANR